MNMESGSSRIMSALLRQKRELERRKSELCALLSHVNVADPEPAPKEGTLGSLDDVNIAIECGRNLDTICGDKDYSLLVWAARNGHGEAVKSLLGHGANVNFHGQATG
jgi:ankyrin repeat protein